MNEKDEVNMKEAADNVILLDEAVFERIVGVLCEVLHGNKYPEERRKILNALDVARKRDLQEIQQQYERQMAMQQSQWNNLRISPNTAGTNAAWNTASTQSIQDQLNYQRARLETQRLRAELEAAQTTQLNSSKLNKFKFW